MQEIKNLSTVEGGRLVISIEQDSPS